MFSCVFCEEEWVYTTNLCENCRRLKHLKKIYRERIKRLSDMLKGTKMTITILKKNIKLIFHINITIGFVICFIIFI